MSIELYITDMIEWESSGLAGRVLRTSLSEKFLDTFFTLGGYFTLINGLDIRLGLVDFILGVPFYIIIVFINASIIADRGQISSPILFISFLLLPIVVLFPGIAVITKCVSWILSFCITLALFPFIWLFIHLPASCIAPKHKSNIYSIVGVDSSKKTFGEFLKDLGVTLGHIDRKGTAKIEGYLGTSYCDPVLVIISKDNMELFRSNTLTFAQLNGLCKLGVTKKVDWFKYICMMPKSERVQIIDFMFTKAGVGKGKAIDSEELREVTKDLPRDISGVINHFTF